MTTLVSTLTATTRRLTHPLSKLAFNRAYSGVPRALLSSVASNTAPPPPLEELFPSYGVPFGTPNYTFNNGEKAKHTFSSSEMERRVAGLRKIMREDGLDAVVLTSIHNVKYFSDFLYCSFGRPYACVVTHDDLTTVSAGIDAGQPWRRTSGGENVVFTDWDRSNYWTTVDSLVKRVASDSSASLRVGLELDALPYERFKKFEAAFGDNVSFGDVGEQTMKFRMKKSKEEVAVIKEAARIADIGGEVCRSAVAIGVPEHEVALATTQAMVREIAKSFPDSELMDTWTWFQSGINTDGAHNPVTTRALELGDILSLNAFPMCSGYYVALERTMFLGEPSPEALRVWEANVKVHEAGIELLKNGVGRTCGSIAKELNEIFRSENLLQFRSFGYGHSFGALCHYYGREAGLELREDIETVLEPGHVISMEPMVTIPNGQPGAGGYREHDILVIGEDDGVVEDITKFPYGPEHNVIGA